MADPDKVILDVHQASDVISTYKLIVAGKQPLRHNVATTARYRRQWADPTREFYGGTSDVMLGYLANGYLSPKLAIGPSSDVVAASQRRLKPNDEGELQVDLALSGFDQPFLDWDERPAKPGLRLVAYFNISCAHEPASVERFGSWLRGFVASLATRGYDISLDVAIQVGELHIGDPAGTTHEVSIRIKKENEAFDGATWTAFLSPTGFRHLMFTAMMISADRAGKKVSSVLGHPRRNADGMTFDPVTRRMTIASNGSNFNPEKATQEVCFALGLDTGNIEWKEQ